VEVTTGDSSSAGGSAANAGADPHITDEASTIAVVTRPSLPITPEPPKS
jgi:hypothetical protein